MSTRVDAGFAKELEKFDVSTLRPIYLLAYHALKSDIGNFYKHVKDAIILDSIDLNTFWDWPLFREFRDNPDYIKTIKSLFFVDKENENDVLMDLNFNRIINVTNYKSTTGKVRCLTSQFGKMLLPAFSSIDGFIR